VGKPRYRASGEKVFDLSVAPSAAIIVVVEVATDERGRGRRAFRTFQAAEAKKNGSRPWIRRLSSSGAGDLEAR
jgi:hypothetical protein